MKKRFIYIVFICLAIPALYACNIDDTNSISDTVSSDSSSISDGGASSSSATSSTDISSGDSSSTFSEYEGFDGYQYSVDENEEDYWYDAGIALPIGVNYHGSNLLENLRRGDIIFEATGFYGITGHDAIVEDIFYSETYEQYYVRIIEAISVGVARSTITPTRIIRKEGSAYRVADANEAQIDEAIEFVIDQLGKPYQLEYAKNYSSTSPNWYCSELIWAAYYHQGFNLDDDNLDLPVTPRETIESSLVESIDL